MLEEWTITIDPERPLDPQGPLDYVALAVCLVSITGAAVLAFTAVYYRKREGLRLIGPASVLCMCLGLVVQLTTVFITNKHLDGFDAVRLASCVFWDYWMYMLAFALIFGALAYGVVTSRIAAIVILPRISAILGALISPEAEGDGGPEEEVELARIVAARPCGQAGGEAKSPPVMPTEFGLYKEARPARRPGETEEQARARGPALSRSAVEGTKLDLEVHVPRRSKARNVPVTLDDYSRLGLVDEDEEEEGEEEEGGGAAEREDVTYRSAAEAMEVVPPAAMARRTILVPSGSLHGEGTLIDVPLDDHLSSQSSIDHEHGARQGTFLIPLPSGVFLVVKAGLLRKPILAALAFVARCPKLLQLKLSRALAVAVVVSLPAVVVLVATFAPHAVTWVEEANSCYSNPILKGSVLGVIYVLVALVFAVIWLARFYSTHRPVSDATARAMVYGNSPTHVSGQGSWPMTEKTGLRLLVAAVRLRLGAGLYCLYVALAHGAALVATLMPPALCGCVATVRAYREDGVHTAATYGGSEAGRAWKTMRPAELAMYAAVCQPVEARSARGSVTSSSAAMVSADAPRRQQTLAEAVAADAMDYRLPAVASLADHMRVRYGAAVGAFAVGVVPLAALNFLGLLSHETGRFVYLCAVDLTYWACIYLVAGFTVADTVLHGGRAMERALRAYRMRRGLPASLAEAMAGPDANEIWPDFLRHVLRQSANTAYLVDNYGEACEKKGLMARVRIKAVNCSTSASVLNENDCQVVFADRVVLALAVTLRLRELRDCIAFEAHASGGRNSATWQQRVMEELYMVNIDMMQAATGFDRTNSGLCQVRKNVPALPSLLLRSERDLETAVHVGAVALLDALFWATFVADRTVMAAARGGGAVTLSGAEEEAAEAQRRLRTETAV